MGVREVKEKAARLVVQGQFERAEVLLRQVLTQVPRDAQTWLKHAEVLKRLSRPADAVASYRLAARILDDEGHHPRAVAALKLALALLPDDIDLITDIIRSEMRTRKGESAVRSVFPISSPSQLLASPLHPSPSAIARDAEGVQLALPPGPTAQLSDAPAVAEPGLGRADSTAGAPSSPAEAPELRPDEAGHVDPETLRADTPLRDAGSEGHGPGRSPDGAETDAARPEPASPPVLGQVDLPPAEPAGLEEDRGLTAPGEAPPGALSSRVGDDGSAGEQPPVAGPAPASERDPGVWLEVGAGPDAWPQVRRLSAQAVAIRASPTSRWVVVSGDLLEVRFLDQLDVPDEAEWLE